MADLIANFISRFWVGLLNLACVPIYAKLMGIESYGLVGFYITLQIVLVTVDAGLSSTVNRDLAKNSVAAENANRMRDGVRTLEIMYWFFAIIIGIFVIIAAPYISKYWLHAHQLSNDVVTKSISLMGLAMVFQWPCGFYQNGLMGLDKQRLSNFLYALTTTNRNVGAVLILYFVSPSIISFFIWQVIANLTMVIPSAILLWKNLPAPSRPARFSKSIYLESRSFVGSMSVISVTAIVLSQLDRVVLSKFITLEEFGFYNIAWTFAGSIYMLQSPVYSFIFPKLTRLVAIGDLPNLKRLYHAGCQLVSLVTMPLAMLVIFFPSSILALWTRNPEIVLNTKHVLVLLACTPLFSTAAQIPFALQQAKGWIKITLITNLCAVVVAIPIAALIVPHYGMLGGASVFVIIKSVCSIVQCELTHAKILPSVRRDWYRIDVGIPLLVSMVTVGLFSCVWRDQGFPSIFTFAKVLTIISITTFAVAFSAPAIRKYLMNLIIKAR